MTRTQMEFVCLDSLFESNLNAIVSESTLSARLTSSTVLPYFVTEMRTVYERAI